MGREKHGKALSLLLTPIIVNQEQAGEDGSDVR
jgi:hypothetical protein